MIQSVRLAFLDTALELETIVRSMLFNYPKFAFMVSALLPTDRKLPLFVLYYHILYHVFIGFCSSCLYRSDEYIALTMTIRLTVYITDFRFFLVNNIVMRSHARTIVPLHAYVRTSTSSAPGMSGVFPLLRNTVAQDSWLLVIAMSSGVCPSLLIAPLLAPRSSNISVMCS
jgi:hypothetical protein